MYKLFLVASLFSGVFANLSSVDPANSLQDLRCMVQEDDMWNMHAWYFVEARSITLKILPSRHYDGHLKDYVDHFLKLVFMRNLSRTVRIVELDILDERERRDLQAVDDTQSYEIEELPEEKRKELNKARSYSGDQEEGHIVIVWDETLLKKYLKTKPSLIIQNTRATYLILYISYQQDTCNDQEAFGRILPSIWRRFKVLNMITFAPCSCNPHTIFKYDPFFYNKAKSTWGLIKQRSLNEARANPFRVINTLRSLKGATLNVTLFERLPSAVANLPPTMKHYDCMYRNLSHGFSGFDGCVLGNLAYYLDFEVNLLNSADYGYRLPNGTYIGSLAEIVYQNADFAANSRFMTSVDMEFVEFTTPVTNDVACFIVPQPKRMPQFMMIFRCFRIETWLALLLMAAMLALFLNIGWRIDFRSDHSSSHPSYVDDVLNVLGILLNVAVNPRTSIYHQRVLLATCMIFNVIIIGIFQGSLFTSFSSISYYPHIDTLEQLYESGLPIATSVNVFEDGESDILMKLKSRRISQSEKAITRAAYKRDIVAVERMGDARFLIQTQYVSEQGVPLLHIVPECPSSYFLAYAVQKDSPYLPRFNDLLTKFLEGGLINKWYVDILNGFIMQKKFHTHNQEQIEKAFSLQDVQTPFYLLICGILLSTITFLGELAYSFKVVKVGKVFDK